MHEPTPLLPPVQGPPRPPDPDVLLVLRPLRDAVPADARLRQLLKVAMRRFRFRCQKCVDAPREMAPLASDSGLSPRVGP
jgi:hypothetical protein